MKLPEFSQHHPYPRKNRYFKGSAEPKSIRNFSEFYPGFILSHFQILEKITEGGMGIVYKALDLNLQRPVALKLLPPNISRQQEKKQQFLEEARLLSVIDHPHICTVHEIFETEQNALIMVMPCYDGHPLRSLLSQNCVPADYAIALTKQIASGLAKAHENGIIHQDVKPENIIVTEDHIVKIIDFGIATLFADQKKQQKKISGTVAYMSPEQIERQHIDFRTDIWSLGVVLYEMLTGLLPFRGQYEQEFIYSIMNEPPEPMTQIPEQLQAIVLKCLEKDVGERYVSMRDLLTDLEIYLARQKRLKEKSGVLKTKKPQRLWSGVAMLWTFFLRAGDFS